MHGRHADRLEEVVAIPASHQSEGNRHVRRAVGRHADCADRLSELCCDGRALVDASGLSLVAAGADGRKPLDVLDRAHARAERLLDIGYGGVSLQVHEVRRPIPTIAGNHPVGRDRPLAASTEIAVGRADDLDSANRLVGDEAGEAVVVSKFALGLAEEVEGGIEAAGNAEEVALDSSAGLIPGEWSGDDRFEGARTLCHRVEDRLTFADVDHPLEADAGPPEVRLEHFRAVVVGEDHGALTWSNAVAVDVGANRAGEQDARTVVVREDERALVRAGG